MKEQWLRRLAVVAKIEASSACVSDGWNTYEESYIADNPEEAMRLAVDQARRHERAWEGRRARVTRLDLREVRDYGTVEG